MAGPVEELAQIRALLADLPQRLADVLRRSDSPLGIERGPDGRFLPRGQPSVGRAGEPVGEADVMRSFRRFASAGAGVPGPGGALMGRFSQAIDLYHRLKELFESGRELRDMLHFQSKGARLMPPGSVPPVQRPPDGSGPGPSGGPPGGGPQDDLFEAREALHDELEEAQIKNRKLRAALRRARGSSKGPAPKPPDWGDSGEGREFHDLQNALDRGAEFDANLQKRFAWLKGRFNEWAGGGPGPGTSGPGPAPGGPNGSGGDASAPLVDAAKQLADAAQKLKDAADKQTDKGKQEGHRRPEKEDDPFGGSQEAEGAGEEVGGLEDVEIAAAFM